MKNHSYFFETLSNFEISYDVVGIVYTFDAVDGHDIEPNNEILLFETNSDLSFYGKVAFVAVNKITLDRPINFNFKAESTQGRIVKSELIESEKNKKSILRKCETCEVHQLCRRMCVRS
jgi:hypothetical protein